MGRPARHCARARPAGARPGALAPAAPERTAYGTGVALLGAVVTLHGPRAARGPPRAPARSTRVGRPADLGHGNGPRRAPTARAPARDPRRDARGTVVAEGM